MNRLLEVCVDSLASARAAIKGGADCLEICSALALGGLTPYTELLQQIREESDINIRCLMHPRAGDFLYAPEETELMSRQIRALKQAGADGFVIGCLTPDGHLDMETMQPLIDAAGGSGLTLHRCIDVSRDPLHTYRDAKKLGIDTVLTSGAAASCMAGLNTIGQLLQLRDSLNGPEILIGAGVKASVITSILEEHPNARAFHMSGKIELESGMRFRRAEVPMGLPGLDEWHIQQTNGTAVRDARSVLDTHNSEF